MKKELEQAKEELIQSIATQLRETPFSVEFHITENPTGIHIINDVTREQMDQLMKMATAQGLTLKEV